MTKEEKLKQLDKLVLDKMIEILDEHPEDLDMLKDLSTPINYLRNNALVEEKKRDDVSDDIKKKLAEAKKRRAKNESK
jgi:hypothetical protein